MFRTLFLFSIIAVLGMALVVGSWERVCADYSSPVNFILFPKMTTTYSPEIVNLWVDKNWQPQEAQSRIPCRIERYSQNDNICIIYSHATWENLSNAGFFARELSQALKCTVVTYDYSGFGKNKFAASERSAKGMNQTLRAVHTYCLQQFSAQQICFFGHSIGAGISISVARELLKENSNSLCVLITIGAFSSLLDLLREHVSGILPENAAEFLAEMSSERWDNVRNLESVHVPLFVMHCKNDSLVPIRHSARVRHNKPNAEFAQLESHGTSGSEFAWNEAISKVHVWMRKLELVD